MKILLSKTEKSRLKSQRMRKNLTDGYVKSVIIESMLYKLKKTDPSLTHAILSTKTVITQEMIIEKRALIKKLKNIKKSGLKICRTCKVLKKKEEFTKCAQIAHSCKDCYKNIQKNYRILNIEKYRLRDRKRRDVDVLNLSNWYLLAMIKQNIKKTTGIVLKSSEIPSELLKLTTKKLLTQRKIESWQKQQQKQ